MHEEKKQLTQAELDAVVGGDAISTIETVTFAVAGAVVGLVQAVVSEVNGAALRGQLGIKP